MLVFVVVIGKSTATCTDSSVVIRRGIFTIATTTTIDGAFYCSIVDEAMVGGTAGALDLSSALGEQ